LVAPKYIKQDPYSTWPVKADCCSTAQRVQNIVVIKKNFILSVKISYRKKSDEKFCAV
jgi:hypothetical protein